MKLIHYGSKQYNSSLFKEIKNINWIKPTGGLWTCPINSTHSWKNWCIGNNFRDCDEENSFIIELKENSKILIIDSVEDLLKLPTEPKLFPSLPEYIDFELLALEYDAIHLTKKGQYETHLSFKRNLYGWDCESVLILNKESILP